ncbi:GNAT family N-acetyltransferase [Desulfatitalea alkaliphila]|uniref:GNAT family N-acetyltransferase n=1 Tax=Desulfatitalea alkaliphila TaxID=2929485 RepID=A0AA41R179_9BACT|nr:GNAT family N-acetyltransferase [Desulfatitalea alkaliphila]MCJ8500139.1 GNAT family N-acetyltransferase [Desulfatitalea alkaliphila]
MKQTSKAEWQKRVVSADAVLTRIEPGMNIFIGTGTAEPRTLVKRLMASKEYNLQDLTLIQLVSFGDAISLEALQSHKYRLRTFFSGWVASEAIAAGHVDLIPARFSTIPRLITSGQMAIDIAFIQITPPTDTGYCSLGVGMDVARQAMEQADLVVGEINADIPFTYGDTFVSMDAFDLLVHSEDPPLYFDRWPLDEIFDRVAANVAAVIEDGSCLAYNIGPIYEALPKHLAGKRDLGIHTPFFTDALMDLVCSGAVSNRRKGIFRGRSLTGFALGSPQLMRWLDHNPLVEFQSVDRVFSPLDIARNPNFVLIIPARRVDLSGRAAMSIGKGAVTTGPGQLADFFNGADLSPGGYTILALPSRNREGEPNVRLSVEDNPNLLNQPESMDIVATEYGIANLRGRTLRERAQALIDIAHPEDRPGLVEAAKEARILFADQIFLADSAHCYPHEVATRHNFKNGLSVRFRAIRPSDEEQMRRLFYRFSDEAIYYRYFAPIKTMTHAKMQEYVNVNYRKVLSIVGVIGDPGQGTIIAEGRYARHENKPYADVAFVVDEEYQGLGIASFLFRLLARHAQQQGLAGLTADVLTTNRAMLKVFERGGFPVQAKLEEGVYALTIPFDKAAATTP